MWAKVGSLQYPPLTAATAAVLSQWHRTKALLAELDAQLAMRKIAGSNYIIRVSISE